MKTRQPLTTAAKNTAREIENRYRCIDAHHEPRTSNPWHGTYCLCGRVIWDRDPVPPTDYEAAEHAQNRTDSVGRAARAYLAEVHGRTP